MDSSKIKLIISALGEERIKLNEPLKYHTFTKLGGPASVLYIATNQKELIGVLTLSLELKIPYLLIGFGTKTFISDEGIDWLVIKNRTSNIKIAGIKGKVGQNGIGIEEALIEIDSGVSIGKLNDFLKTEGLEEFLAVSSLKSSVGGSIFLDSELQKKVQKIKVWNKGEIEEVEIENFNTKDHIVLTIFIKVKSNKK